MQKWIINDAMIFIREWLTNMHHKFMSMSNCEYGNFICNSNLKFRPWICFWISMTVFSEPFIMHSVIVLSVKGTLVFGQNDELWMNACRLVRQLTRFLEQIHRNMDAKAVEHTMNQNVGKHKRDYSLLHSTQPQNTSINKMTCIYFYIYISKVHYSTKI